MTLIRLNVSREEGGRGLTSIEDRVDSSIRAFKDYIKRSKDRLIIAASNSNYNIRTNIPIIIRKQEWEEKQLYEYFK